MADDICGVRIRFRVIMECEFINREESQQQLRSGGGQDVFDMEQRMHMRQALLHYMKEHRIGVPALQARIARANSRDLSVISLKTLQGFLAGVRTHDGFLRSVHHFIDRCPESAGAQRCRHDVPVVDLVLDAVSPERGEGTSRP